jgi:hypothetical protein
LKHKKLWQRVGSRCGPGKDASIPTKLPSEHVNDRGMFMELTDHETVWRRGRWEKRLDKVEKKEKVDFFFYGPGYFDYECTNVAYPEEEFGGVE